MTLEHKEVSLARLNDTRSRYDEADITSVAPDLQSQVHLVPLRDISLEGLTQYLMRFESRYDRILGYRPTGWT